MLKRAVLFAVVVLDVYWIALPDRGRGMGHQLHCIGGSSFKAFFSVTLIKLQSNFNTELLFYFDMEIVWIHPGSRANMD